MQISKESRTTKLMIVATEIMRRLHKFTGLWPSEVTIRSGNGVMADFATVKYNPPPPEQIHYGKEYSVEISADILSRNSAEIVDFLVGTSTPKRILHCPAPEGGVDL